MDRPTLVSPDVATTFPLMVIEVPKKSYATCPKTQMCVASSRQGQSKYEGPQRVCPVRWMFIKTIYIVELSNCNYYQAKTLTHYPHYSILRSELAEYEDHLFNFINERRIIKIRKISYLENYKDEYLIVINKMDDIPTMNSLISAIDDTNLLNEVMTHGKVDSYRGNMKLDFGYACGQNLERNSADFGTTMPRLLD